MRILQVHTPHRHQGGEDAVVEQERRLLESHRHVVEQVLVENPVTAGAAAVAVLQAPWNRSAAQRVLRAARAFRPDVVHVHNTWFALSPSVVVALAKAGMPVVVTLHNFRTVCINALLLRRGKPCELCVASHPVHGIVHRCYRGSAVLSASAALTVSVPRHFGVWQRRVAQFLVLDQSAVDPLVAGGIPADLITVRPNFVSDEGPRPAPPSSSNEVVYVGRLSPEKGLPELLDAWRRTPPPGLRLSVYGDGPLRQRLADQPVAGVTFRGRVDRTDVGPMLRQARALIFPSTCREAGPLAPIEALAAGLPVVISHTVGMSHEIAEAGGGWATVDRPRSLDTALSQLLDDETINRAGIAARNLYLKRYSEAAALRSLEAVYQQVSYRHVTPA
jgi:glycosyltransferase involved in cell wall biosynthesis